jgi:hypothetical protein
MNLDFFENKYFFAVFVIFITLYAVQIRPTLPPFIVNLFQNPIFRVVILFLVLVRGYKDPQFAILVAISFVLIMNVINEQIFKEKFTTVPTTTPVPNECTEDVIKNAQKEIDNYTDLISKTPTCNESDTTCKDIIASYRSKLSAATKIITNCSN